MLNKRYKKKKIQPPWVTVKTVWVCMVEEKDVKTEMTEKPSGDYDWNRWETWSFSPPVLKDEDERDSSQKDHLSCVRGSMEREGDSDGGWLLLSSPFKLFLHTGHVSCCIQRGEYTVNDISCGLKLCFPILPFYTPSSLYFSICGWLQM